jgi:hypothetical protein
VDDFSPDFIFENLCVARYPETSRLQNLALPSEQPIQFGALFFQAMIFHRASISGEAGTLADL